MIVKTGYRLLEHSNGNSSVYFLKFHCDAAKYSACLRSQQGQATCCPALATLRLGRAANHLHPAMRHPRVRRAMVSAHCLTWPAQRSPVNLGRTLFFKRLRSLIADSHLKVLAVSSPLLLRGNGASFIHKFRSTDDRRLTVERMHCVGGRTGRRLKTLALHGATTFIHNSHSGNARLTVPFTTVCL